MTYTQYLKDGNEIQQFTEEEAEMIKVLQPYSDAFKQNPLATIQAAANDFKFSVDSPRQVGEFLAGLSSYAQLAGDKDLELNIQNFVESEEGKKLISEEPMFKCGGKVRTKVKKACGGKKLEKGSKVPEVKKGGCPCQWKKVGGRIIEVDCNGIPVAKEGAVLFARLGDGLRPINTTLDVNPNLLGGSNYQSQYLWGNGGSRTAVAPPTKQAVQVQPTKSASYYIPQGKVAASKFIYDVMNPVSSDNTWQYMSERVQQGLAPVSETVINEMETGKVTGKSPRQVDEKEAAMRAEEDRRLREYEEKHAFGAGKLGTFGGLTFDQALARQREMQAAKDRGFTVDLGRWGADGKWGNQSRSEWERYQQWKANQELSALKAQNADLKRLNPDMPLLVGYNKATIVDSGKGAMLRTPSVNIQTQFGNSYIPSTYTEESTGKIYKFTPLAKNGTKFNYANYLK